MKSHEVNDIYRLDAVNWCDLIGIVDISDLAMPNDSRFDPDLVDEDRWLTSDNRVVDRRC